MKSTTSAALGCSTDTIITAKGGNNQNNNYMQTIAMSRPALPAAAVTSTSFIQRIYRQLLLATFVLLGLGVGQSWGQLLLSENFTSYSIGNLGGQGSWTQAGSGPLATINNASPFTYSGYNGGLGGEYAVIPTASSTSSRCYKGFTSTAFANKTFYYSVIINLTSVSATGDYFITLGDPTTGTTYFARLFAKASGGGYNLGISKISNTASYGSSIYNLNQSYLVVVRYTSSSTTTTDDGVYMWVNPTLSVTEPTTGTAEASILPAALLTDPAPSGGNVGNFHWHNRSTNNPVGKFDGVKVSVGSTSGAAWTSLDALACTAPSITSATAGANPICANATTTLTAVVTGTNPSVTWWTGPNGTGTPVGTGLVSDPVGPGTYHAYATGDCGTDDETVVVTGQALPNAGTDGTLNICSSTTLTEALLFGALNGSPSGGGSWSPSPAGAGVYTYTVAATAPCTVDATATVTVSVQALPNAGTDGTLTICSSTTLTTTLLFNALGGTPDGTGSWSPAPAGAGVYTYTVTGTSPCPNASATVTVSVQAAPNATIAYSAATYTTADAAQSVNITGTPNTGTFSAPGGLSINAATGQITPSTSTPATYLVTYTVAASGECPLYTTTTSVTINLYVATPLDCATPLNFSSPVVLSPTQAPNVWYTDRYAPNGFAISNDLGGSTLKHSINAADGEVSRPPAYVSSFYNTQGRKYDLEANSASLKIKLYVPSSWATSNKRMAGLWGTAFDNLNAVSAYPILEFTSDGANPRFRVWESGTGVFVDLGLPGGFAYDTWVDMSIKLRSDGEFQYKVGNLVYTTTTSSGDGSVKLANTILQGHNNNPGVTYDIYWDDLASNTVSLFTNTVTGCGTADLTTAAVTSGSVLPGGTTLGYFTDQACAFSVPDATQVGAGPYYIRATAPGGCFEVQPVTVTIQAAPTATIAYSAATYTTADPAQSVNITGTPNTGTFSAPAGLSINAATGQITPSTSTPGSYVVTYTVAASGVCPLYTTTTNVTINLFVPALFDCATPLDFSSAVALSPTQAPNVWYTDRYAPNGFAISNDLGGSTLKHSINAADGQPGTVLPVIGFYNTQGRKYDLEANSASLKIKLYVPASWASSGRRMAGLWGTAFDNTNNVSGYPIVEFSANSEGTGVPRFRCYETGSGAWVDLGLPAGFVYDSWVEMSIKLRSDGEFQYKVGNLVYTTTTGSGDGSVKIANVILQGYNLTTGVTYDIYWDDLASNTVSLIVTNPTGACPSVSLTASAVTALSKMPLGTTLSYFTNPACTFSVPDATQVGSGTYYIKATAPGGCFDVEPVTVSLGGSVHNVTQLTDHCTIQAAIDAANPGDHIKVDAGTYHESASNRYVFGVNGPHKFGLFIDKDNLLIEGLDASNNTVTSAGNAAAVVTTNATNNFGVSGIFVQANGVTIKGLKIGNNYNDANAIDNNKTIEVVGNNFTLDKTWISTASDEGAVYMGRWDVAHPITTYSLTNNKFENTLISINNGIGLSGPRAGRVITGNEFVGVATPYLIGFRGWNGAGPVQGWIVDPVGGAVVTGNTFNTTGVVNYIVARGNAGGYVNSELDWQEMWNMNTYGNHVVTLTNYPGFDVRTYTDGAGYPETRRISPAIQENIDIAAAGDAVLVSAGVYKEDIVVNQSVSILGPNATVNPCSGTRVAEAIVVPATAAISSGEIFHVAASNVTISGFTIDGDNPSLNSGYTSTNVADIDAAEGITVYETGVNNLTVTNNIIKNLSYFGVTLYDYPAAVPSSGHVIADNKIQDLGTYDAGSGLSGWGGGVLLYNNQYAAVTNNCISNVRIGVQTGNFSQANPGGPASQVISGNTISARRRGIFHNLFYGAASPYTVSNNTITGVVNTNEVVWDGILIASQAIASTASNNIINGAGITNPSEGIEVWNTLPAPTVSGGNISNVNIGVSVNNFEGYSSNADPTAATIDGVTISGVTAAGIKIHDNPLNTNGATVTAEVKNTTITGGAAGILVSGADATANIHNNPSTITGAAIGIDVNAGAATVYRNTITANGIGVRSINGGKLTSVTENFITNNTSDGIQVAADAGVTGNINTNNLAGNTGFGINNLSAPTLAATCNWFGSNVAAAVAAKVSGNVTYILYLATGTDEQPGTGGFQNTSCKTIVVADPALVDVNITTTSDVLINANLVPLNSTNRVHVPILNLDQDPTHIVPAGTTKVRIDLGDKLKLNLSFNLATAPLNTYFNWTKVVESGNDVIYGDQIADLPADFVGDAWFEVDAITPGLSLITANFQVTNHNNPTKFLVDEVTTNNAANLNYTVLTAFTITLDNTTNVTCFGGSNGSITVHANGGATPYQYSIDGGTTWLPAVPTAGGHTFSGLTAGTYTIQARDFLSQIVTLVPNVTITEPPVITLSPTETHVNVSCYSGSDGSIDLSVSGGGGTPGYTYAYSWTASAGGVVPSGQENNQDLSGLLQGDYTVQVTVTDNAGCVKVFPAALTVTITQPTILSATVNSTNVLCNGANDGTITITVPLGGYGTYEYRLNAGAWQVSGNFTGLAPATYSVQIRDAAHPTCTQVIGSVLITEPPVLNASVTAINHVTCAGNSSGSVTVTATGGTPGYTYSLDAGPFLNNGGTFTGLAAGPHTVVAKDANGCLKSVPFTITEPLNTDVTLGAVFDNNFFLTNGDEINVVYNIIEIAGKAATPAVLRIFKPAGYDVIFNNSLSSLISLPVDNQKWTQTFANSLYYEFTRNGPGGNNKINCYEFLRLGFTVKRNTFNVSTFNLNAQFRAAVSEVILNNNNISLLLVGQ